MLGERRNAWRYEYFVSKVPADFSHQDERVLPLAWLGGSWGGTVALRWTRLLPTWVLGREIDSDDR